MKCFAKSNSDRVLNMLPGKLCFRNLFRLAKQTGVLLNSFVKCNACGLTFVGCVF